MVHGAVPQVTNLYGYVLNDPINLIDPNGLVSCPPNQKPIVNYGQVAVCVASDLPIDEAIVVGCAACAAGKGLRFLPPGAMCAACAGGVAAAAAKYGECVEQSTVSCEATLCDPIELQYESR